MRPMMRLVLGLIALVVILAAVSLGLPAHVTVARSVVINAPESAVFPYVNNLRHFTDWAPWRQRDPQLKVAYSGPEQGKGAAVAWTSEVKSIGSGSMEITESDPNRHIALAVNFNGLDGTSAYEIVPAGSGSKLTWNFGYETGSSPLKRWKGLMLDGFVGSEYRAGLEKLKEKIESERRPTAPPVVLPPAEGGVSVQPEQPQGALPLVSPGGADQPQGAAPAPEAAPAPQGAAQEAPPAAEAVAPAPPKKKRKAQQR